MQLVHPNETEWGFVSAAFLFYKYNFGWLIEMRDCSWRCGRAHCGVLVASQWLLLTVAVCLSAQQMSTQQVALLSTDSLLFPAGRCKKNKKNKQKTWQSAISVVKIPELMANIIVPV